MLSTPRSLPLIISSSPYLYSFILSSRVPVLQTFFHSNQSSPWLFMTLFLAHKSSLSIIKSCFILFFQPMLTMPLYHPFICLIILSHPTQSPNPSLRLYSSFTSSPSLYLTPLSSSSSLFSTIFIPILLIPLYDSIPSHLSSLSFMTMFHPSHPNHPSSEPLSIPLFILAPLNNPFHPTSFIPTRLRHPSLLPSFIRPIHLIPLYKPLFVPLFPLYNLFYFTYRSLCLYFHPTILSHPSFKILYISLFLFLPLYKSLSYHPLFTDILEPF
ncbi:hypothetical protein ILYODFUR_023414 [Ilyodon furcidens]|uniref:Uncharacterized protein n=1 Tax=Ilyodon furcidens TaxID=33524 RepID=A0ABV0TCC6_9TELE